MSFGRQQPDSVLQRESDESARNGEVPLLSDHKEPALLKNLIGKVSSLFDLR